MRVDGRRPDELRPITVERGFNRYAEGSVLITWGNTKVHCTASVEERVPQFLRGSGSGWVTAEYAMLPRSTRDRTSRDAGSGKLNGRSSEIQRLIGRSLRPAVDLGAIGERTIWLDCDVLQADGGTRTAAITGSYIALVDALRVITDDLSLKRLPTASQVAAVSVGKVGGVIMLDLCYSEDHSAEVDFNIVMNSRGEFVELQGSGEHGFFSREELDEILRVAAVGLSEIFALQRDSLGLRSSE